MLKDKKHKNQSIRPPRIGQIKVGEKTDAGLPTSTDHFVIDSDYAGKVIEKYDIDPKALRIFFPFDDIESNLDEMYRFYGSSGIKCIGDGETFTKFSDKMKDPPKCPCDLGDPPEGQKQQCFPSMIMAFVIKGIGVTGVWHFSSKSVYSRNNVRASMQMVKAVSGKLAGMPFIMRVEMRKSATSDSSHKFPVVTVDCEMDIEKLAEKRIQIEGELEKVKELEPPVTSKTEQKSEETEQEAKFTPLIQHQWDEFDKYLNSNKAKLPKDVYSAARKWLDEIKKPTVEKLILNLSKVKGQESKDKVSSDGYESYHESLITACCDTLKTKDRLPVIQTLNILVRKWKIEGKEKLKDCTENECLNLLEAFDKQLKDDDEADLPY